MAHKHEHMPTSNEDTRTYRPLSVEERDRLAQQVGARVSDCQSDCSAVGLLCACMAILLLFCACMAILSCTSCGAP